MVCIHCFTRPLPMPRPRFILNNIPAFRQVCTAVDFSYSALRHALGPRDVRNLYRARATKDRKTSLVASCTWKQTVVFTYSTGLKKKVSIIKWLQFIHKRAPAELLFTGKEIFFPSFCEIIDHVSERITDLITDKQQILEILASDRFSAAGNGYMTLVEFLLLTLKILKSTATDSGVLFLRVKRFSAGNGKMTLREFLSRLTLEIFTSSAKAFLRARRFFFHLSEKSFKR